MDASTRGGSLQGPLKAWRVPLILAALVGAMVLVVLVAAKVVGWWALLLVPVALFSLAIAVNVVVALVKGRRKET